MRTLKSFSVVFRWGIALAFLLAAISLTPAQTIWNGPNVGFYHPYLGAQDQLTANVIFTRGSGGGLYNSALEAGATPGISPKGTAWAVGTLANYNTLSYGACPLEAGERPPNDIGKTYVVHLITNNIYLQLTLTNWGGAGGVSGQQTFGYTRSTPALAVPTVSITNPVGGAVFAAPASLKLGASASVSSGAVTNVAFFANSTLLGSVTVAPFNLTSSPLAAGAYALAAVATASGISATSAVANVTVVNPVAVSLSGVNLNSSQFAFNYTANAGLTYMVQSSSNLVNWVSLTTNVASGSPVPFSGPFNSTGMKFYRVGRLPNP